MLANERVTYIACGGSSSAAVTGEMSDYVFCMYNDIYVALYYFSHTFCIFPWLLDLGALLPSDGAMSENIHFINGDQSFPCLLQESELKNFLYVTV